MDKLLADELSLASSIRLTADPPVAWIEAAAAIPALVGDLEAIDALVTDPEFRRHFAEDPASALSRAGLPVSAPVLSAVRDCLD